MSKAKLSMFDILDPDTRKNKLSLNIFIPLLYMRNMDSSSQIAFLHRRKLNMVGKELVPG